MHFSSCVVYGGLAHLGLSLYQVQDVYNSSNWADSFMFDTEDDPTLGYVDYLDHDSAVQRQMFSTDNDVVTFGADSKSIGAGRGRGSVRLVSYKNYNHALVVADIAHMPGSVCGTWNAFWTSGPNWPTHGEIDIIEGINSNHENMMTQHTSPGCTMATQDCSQDTGCRKMAGGPRSYGDGFNANGGGVYAMEWTNDHINIWFWQNGTQPSDLSGDSPDPAGWGTPTAAFNGGYDAATCDIDSNFRDHAIIFDTTFCGMMAQPAFPLDEACSALGTNCVDYVANNPSAFAETYWSIKSLKVYQQPATDATDTTDTTDTTPVGKNDDDDDDDKDDKSDNDDDDDDDKHKKKKKKKHHHHHHKHHHHTHRHHHHKSLTLKRQATAAIVADIPMPTI